jgi:hypothetical protein
MGDSHAGASLHEVQHRSRERQTKAARSMPGVASRSAAKPAVPGDSPRGSRMHATETHTNKPHASSIKQARHPQRTVHRWPTQARACRAPARNRGEWLCGGNVTITARLVRFLHSGVKQELSASVWGTAVMRAG